MTHTIKARDGSYVTLCEIRTQDILYENSIDKIYEKCVEISKLYNIPLEDMDLSLTTEYGDELWYISYNRPATTEEIESYHNMIKQGEAWERSEFERMKKKFEGEVKNV